MASDLSRYKTAHQLARDLLAGPDLIVVMPTPAFEMPGSFVAFPVTSIIEEVEGKPVVSLMPDVEVLKLNEPLETPKQDDPSSQISNIQSPGDGGMRRPG